MMIFNLRPRWESGDTLIEITMALAILSSVLLSSTSVVAKASLMGRVASERTTITNESQSQLEALRAFRDNHTWDQFLNGSTTGTAFFGVLSPFSPSTCKISTLTCMHMGGSPSSLTPVASMMVGSVPTSYIEITTAPGPGAIPQYVEVTLNYGFINSGGSESTGHIKTTFTNLQYAVATPPLPPPPTPIPPPPPPPPAGGSPCYDPTWFSQGGYAFNFMDLATMQWPDEQHLHNGTGPQARPPYSPDNNLEYRYGIGGVMPVPTITYPNPSNGGVPISLVAGTYRVDVLSYEDHVINSGINRLSTDTRPTTLVGTDFERATELYEQYNLEISIGGSLYTTQYTSDIPDGNNIGVSTDVITINTGGVISQIVAAHIPNRDKLNNQKLGKIPAGDGVSPVCVMFTKL